MDQTLKNRPALRNVDEHTEMPEECSGELKTNSQSGCYCSKSKLPLIIKWTADKSGASENWLESLRMP